MKKSKRITHFTIPLIFFIVGAYAHELCNFSLIQVSSATLLLLVGLIVTHYKNQTRATKILLKTLFFATGALLLNLQKTQYAMLLNKHSNQMLSLIGRVKDKEFHTKKNYAQTIILEIEKVKSEGEAAYHPASFSLLCYSKTRVRFDVDDTIELTNVKIKDTASKTLSGNPTFNAFLIKENMLSTIFLTKKNAYTVLHHPSMSWQRFIWHKATMLKNSIRKKLSRPGATYFSLIFLGNKQEGRLEPLRQRFNTWGLSHYLARSGLHIVLFILIWQFLLNLIPLHQNLKRIALMLICLIYHLLSWPSISFLRAYYVFLLMQFGMLIKQQVNFFHLLSIVCLITLAYNPMQLFFLDFQLTFALTFALSWQSELS